MDRDVQLLGERVKRGRAERAQEDAWQKARSARRKEIDEAPQQAMTGFWCETCARDFSAMGWKCVNWVYNLDTGMSEPPEVWRAWYSASCPKGHHCIRRITDKVHDPYFRQSIALRRQQAEHADDFLTPADPRFKQVYPVQWARIQEEQRQREEMNATPTP